MHEFARAATPHLDTPPARDVPGCAPNRGSDTARAATFTGPPAVAPRAFAGDRLTRLLARSVRERALERHMHSPLLQRFITSADDPDIGHTDRAEEGEAITQALNNCARARQIFDVVPQPFGPKCVAVGGPTSGRVVGLSGWGRESEVTVATNDKVKIPSGEQATWDVMRLTQEALLDLGYALPSHAYDQGVPGRYYSSHAERQVSTAAPGEPIGVVMDMCSDCVPWFRHRARQLDRLLVVATMWNVNLFDRAGTHWMQQRRWDGYCANRFVRQRAADAAPDTSGSTTVSSAILGDTTTASSLTTGKTLTTTLATPVVPPMLGGGSSGSDVSTSLGSASSASVSTRGGLGIPPVRFKRRSTRLDRPTESQLTYLKILCSRRGVTFRVPLTKDLAAEGIDELLKKP